MGAANAIVDHGLFVEAIQEEQHGKQDPQSVPGEQNKNNIGFPDTFPQLDHQPDRSALAKAAFCHQDTAIGIKAPQRIGEGSGFHGLTVK